MAVTGRPGAVVYTDIVCGWSAVAPYRCLEARERRGLDDEVRVDPQLFLLEDVNKCPIPKRFLDTEVPVVGALALDSAPCIKLRWEGEPGAGSPVVDEDDPSAMDQLVQRAAQAA
jgi:hypothetical protein